MGLSPPVVVAVGEAVFGRADFDGHEVVIDQVRKVPGEKIERAAVAGHHDGLVAAGGVKRAESPALGVGERDVGVATLVQGFDLSGGGGGIEEDITRAGEAWLRRRRRTAWRLMRNQQERTDWSFPWRRRRSLSRVV